MALLTAGAVETLLESELFGREKASVTGAAARKLGKFEAAEDGPCFSTRLASIAALGLIPMLLSNGVGSEGQRPLATVVVEGLVSATLLTLFVLPTLHRLFSPSARDASTAAADGDSR